MIWASLSQKIAKKVAEKIAQSAIFRDSVNLDASQLWRKLWRKLWQKLGSELAELRILTKVGDLDDLE